MYSLPISITVNKIEYNIRNKADYRVILDCFNVLQSPELNSSERLVSALIIFLEDMNSYADIVTTFNTETLFEEAVKEMFNFFNCGQTAVGAIQSHKLIDWQADEQIISAAINNVAKVEIRTIKYCHWWTFMGYYTSIGESVLSTVVGIRNKIVKGTKLEKYEQEFKKDNPQYFAFDYRTREQIEADEKIRKMWEGK